MIRDRNIVCIASNWSIDPTSKHQVMKLLAGHNHIVWVNYHGSRRPSARLADLRSIGSKVGQFLGGMKRVSANIDVLTPIVIPMPDSKSARAVNRRLLDRQVRHVLRGLPRRPVQVWSFAPDVSFLAGAFDEERFVYYCVDEFSAFEGYDAGTIRTLERDLIEKASVVLTTSGKLYESKRSMHSNTHLVPHGVDHDHFATATDPDTEIPDDVREISRPIIGFYGLIEHWVDLELVGAVARRRTDWSFVLIGDVVRATGPCGGLPNVHFLGRRPYAELPGYSKAFDVGVIPFAMNALTAHVNPIKLREYLSAALPVVSTPLPEVERYEPLVSVADGAEAFESAIQRVLDEDSPAKARERQSAMRGEAWSARVEEISDLVMAAEAGVCEAPRGGS